MVTEERKTWILNYLLTIQDRVCGLHIGDVDADNHLMLMQAELCRAVMAIERIDVGEVDR